MYKKNKSNLTFYARLFTLSSFVLFLLCVESNPVSSDKADVLQGAGLKIPFSKFSPAYAALEDEFLFNANPATQLKSGKSNDLFLEKQKLEEVQIQGQPKIQYQKHALSLSEWVGLENQNIAIPKEASTLGRPLKLAESPIENQQKLSLKNNIFAQSSNLKKPAQGLSVSIGRNKLSPKNRAPRSDLNTKSKPTEEIVLKGVIELKDGLAFLGTMEVSWVVDDEEQNQGYINTVDATYEIAIQEKIGEIFISLFDENDQLYGEGYVSLSEINSEDFSKTKINVRPIDWDQAGQIVDVRYLHPDVKPVPVKDVKVELYALNQSSLTNQKGEMRFPDWKKSNSRTLALASKQGYKDSIFLIDSKNSLKTLLFPLEYMSSFFSWIEELGIFDVRDKGTIYGAILSGNQPQAGYTIRIEGYDPLYFTSGINLATLNQETTGDNGLFSFVGMDDGEYQLFVEKDGFIYDRRIVLVEQGAVSPLFIDLRGKKKKLKFFDPFDPKTPQADLTTQFFDGEKILNTNENGSIQSKTASGGGPNLVDYTDGSGVYSSTFISRQRGIEFIPVLKKDWLKPLLQRYQLSEEKGLAIGYAKAPLKFYARLEEYDVETTLYFNSKGELVDPNHEIAYGYIIAGFPEGLHTVVIESIEAPMFRATDLIYADHQSISVLNFDLDSL